MKAFANPPGTALSQSMKAIPQTSLWQLIQNELYKLWKHRVIWILLGVDLFFVFTAWCVLVFYAMKTHEGFEPGHLLGGPEALRNALSQPLILGRRGGMFIAAALGGLAFGSEFSNGSIRLILSRGVNRAAYLLSKYVALTIVCLVLVLASLLLSVVLTSLLILFHQPAPTLLGLDGPTLQVVFSVCVGSYESFVFCLLFGSALALVARSAAFGMAGSFAYLIGEDIAAQILPVLGRALHTQLGTQIVSVLYTTNLNAFYADMLPTLLAQGLDRLDGVVACTPVDGACIAASPTQSLLVTLVWGLVLAGVSTVLFLKRDVLQ